MPEISGSVVGQRAKVYVSPVGSGSGNTLVAAVKEPKFPTTLVTADQTTNDDGFGGERHGIIRKTGDLSFTMIVSLTDPCQVILRDAAENGTYVMCDFVQTGLKGTGVTGKRFEASVSIDPSHPRDGFVEASVTLKRSGPVTPVTY